MSRIYKVSLTATASVVRFVRAENAARALRAVTGELYSVEIASSDDIFDAVRGGNLEILDAVRDEFGAEDPGPVPMRATG
jgi:hypothetical protein